MSAVAVRSGVSHLEGVSSRLLASAATAMLVATALPRGRAHRTYVRPRVQAVALDIYVEAEPRDRAIGVVKGYAIAVASREHRWGADTWVLVNDPSRPAAIWVKESEIRQRSVSGEAPRPHHDA